MERQEIGRFYAKTFDGKQYEFVVKDDGRIYCDDFEQVPLYRLWIKPRFEVFGEGKCFLSKASCGVVDGLIESFEISDEVFDYLKEKKLISYSTDMAYFYGFKDKEGFDFYCQKRAFKHVHDKSKVLSKQKNGYFH